MFAGLLRRVVVGVTVLVSGVFSAPAAAQGPNGACCLPSGACTILSQTACSFAGGVWAGFGIACSADVPCTGACCQADGACSITTRDACEAGGGLFRGFVTSCDANDTCLGACCLEDGSCTFGTRAECDVNAGNFRAGATCQQAACHGVVGACCCYNGNVCEVMTEAACQTFNCNSEGGPNIWLGPGTTCAPQPCTLRGACCVGSECMLLDVYGCALYNGYFRGVGTTCDNNACSTGACCVPSQLHCYHTTPLGCYNAGGVWRGWGTRCEECDPVGACCAFDIEFAVCSVVTQANCQTRGGVWFGAGTACSSYDCTPLYGACCLPGGLCATMFRSQCESQGGAAFLPDRLCDVSPAFCTPPNDWCEGAILLTCGQTVIADNIGATYWWDDPGIACGHPGSQQTASLWYKFIAGSSSATISTCGTIGGGRSELMVWSTIGDPNNVCGTGIVDPFWCSAGSACGGTLASVTAHGLTPGGLYYIQLTVPTEADRRAFTLSLTCEATPSNDQCTSPTPIVNEYTGGTLVGASPTSDFPQMCAPDGELGADVFFRYTPWCNGTAVFEVLEAGFDSVLAVYECGNYAESAVLACADGGSATPGAARLTYGVTADVPIIVRVSSKSPGDLSGFSLRSYCIEAAPNISPAAIIGPGLTVDYYDTSFDPQELPQFGNLVPYATTTVANIEQGSTQGEFMNSGRSELVGAVFSGVINVPSTDVYFFSMSSDDGSKLEIDGQEVINLNGVHSAQSLTGFIALAAGPHYFRLEYFERYGDAQLILTMRSSTLIEQAVPPEYFSRIAPLTNDGCATAQPVTDLTFPFDSAGANNDAGNDLCSAWGDLYYRLPVPFAASVNISLPTLFGSARVEVFDSIQCPPQPGTQLACQVLGQNEAVNVITQGATELLIRIGSTESDAPVSGTMSIDIAPLISSTACCLNGTCFLMTTANCISVGGTILGTLSCNSSCCYTLQNFGSSAEPVCPGDDATIYAYAQSTGPLTYQWLRNNVPLQDIPGVISGSQTANLTIHDVELSDGGYYFCEINGVCASTELERELHVLTEPPSFVIQQWGPGCPGNYVVLLANVSDYYTSVQWLRNGQPLVDIPEKIEGSNTVTMVIYNLSLADLGEYECTVGNGCYADTQATSVSFPNTVMFLSQPQSQAVCEGGLVSLSANVQGAGARQWRKNGQSIPGATGNSHFVSPMTAADVGTYDVVVTQACGAAISAPAEVTMIPLATITQHPINGVVCEGASFAFSVGASGENLTYQWRRNTVNIPDANAPTFTLAAATPADNGLYSCIVTSSCGSVTSNSASLFVQAAYEVNAQPQSQTVCTNPTPPFVQFTFDISGGGSGRTYQWRRNSVNIPGATNATYGLVITSEALAGTYDCVVNSTCGSLTSAAAVLTINVPISGATVTPNTLAACEGTPAQFAVTATGTITSYQWRRNGAPIPGATSNPLVIPSPTAAADAGVYSCVISGPCSPGGVTVGSALLTVPAATVVTQQPSPPVQTVCSGSNVSYAAAGTGTGTVTYQWRRNGVPIPGATGGLSLTNVQTSASGVYDCVITSSCGSVTTNSVLLTVNQSTAIVQQPQSVQACLGAQSVFSISAVGTSLTYQWFKQGQGALAGRTSSTLVLPSISAADLGSYTCVVTGSCGVVTSSSAILNLGQAPTFAFILGSDETTICPQDPPRVLESATDATLPRTYQWRKDGQDVPGETGATLTIDPGVGSFGGQYTVIVSNSCGTLESNVQTVYQGVAPQITSQPVPRSVCAGSGVTFSVGATGTPHPDTYSLGYQWQRNGGNIGGAVSAIYTIPNPTPAHAGLYRCIVSNPCGSVTSTEVELVVFASGTVITSQPQSVVGCVGTNAEFSVSAEGAPPITYQWRSRRGEMFQSISGATGPTLVVPITSAGTSGEYDVVVTSACGPTTSSPVTFTGVLPAVFTQHPQGGTVCGGGMLTLTAAATNGPDYQWRRNGVNIPGATLNSYTITGASSQDAGTYDCIATNACGPVASSPAVVAVCLPDFNCDGVDTVSDIFAFLSAWFAQLPAADFDGDSVIQVPDIFAFLSAWFASC